MPTAISMSKAMRWKEEIRVHPVMRTRIRLLAGQDAVSDTRQTRGVLLIRQVLKIYVRRGLGVLLG